MAVEQTCFAHKRSARLTIDRKCVGDPVQAGMGTAGMTPAGSANSPKHVHEEAMGKLWRSEVM